MAEMTYNITLTANHQSLTAEYLPLAAESVQYLTAKVVCETEDWTGREIKAMFGQGCTVHGVPVTDGEITAKQQLNLTAGDWCVWLVGNSARDGEVIPRITTNIAHISVAPTGGTEGNPFPTIPPTVEEQLRADMGNLADLTTEDKSSLVAAINEAAASGGSKDAVTYTPQTLTEEQQEQARTNIGAGQPVFAVNITDGVVVDKTAAEIEAAYQAGRTIVCRMIVQFGNEYTPVELPLKSRTQERVFLFALDQLSGERISSLIVNISDSGVTFAPQNATIYEKPASGIPKSDLAEDVQTSLAKADTAISLGLTAATPGQIIKVKTVQDGKPTEWEAVNMPSGGSETWEKLYDGTIQIEQETMLVEVDIPRDDSAKEFHVYLHFTKNVAQEWDSPKLIQVHINGAQLGYFVIYDKLTSDYYCFAKRVFDTVGRVELVRVNGINPENNLINVVTQLQNGSGYEQTNTGKIRISFAAAYAGSIELLVYGRY